MYVLLVYYFFFFCKQKTAYEMRISDWSSDVCSSDLAISCMLERGSNHFDSDLATCRASRRWRALASDGWGQTAGGPVGWPAAVGSASSLSSCPSWQISVGSRDKNLVLSMANDLGIGAATSP